MPLKHKKLAPGDWILLALTVVNALAIVLAVGFAISQCAGCSSSEPRYTFVHPSQERATEIVWAHLYGMVNDPPPSVEYRCDRCGEPIDGGPPDCNVLMGDRCVGGYYTPWDHRAIVNYGPMLWDTSFAHELLHASLDARGLDGGDPTHARPEWFTTLPLAIGLLAVEDL